MATIKDIASAAGVSVGTVSNVINGIKNVSEEKARRVYEVIRQEGYFPNSIARTLKTNISKTVGLIIPDIMNPFYAEVARGVEDRIKPYGYTLFLCNKDRSPEKEAEYADALMEKNVDGIILVKPTLDAEKTAMLCRKCRVVMIDTDLPANENFAVINVDDEESAYAMTELIYGMGHREIAYFSGNVDARSDRLRLKGYRRFMEEKGIFREGLLFACGKYDIAAGYHRADALLKCDHRPTAIFASNDILAIGVIQAICDNGLHVPQDFSVAGCDDISLLAYVRPQLTTILRPKYEMGSTSADILISLLDGRKKCPPYLVLSSNLTVRQSVAPPR